MKIGLLIYGSLDIVTGGFIYDRKMMDYLVAAGHDLKIFALPWRSYPAHLTDNFKRSFAEGIAESGVDVLIEDELNHPSLFLLNRIIRKRFSGPILSIVHHLRCNELRSYWSNRLYGIVERLYLETVDGFIFNSKTTRKSVFELVGDRKPNVVVFPGREEEIPIQRLRTFNGRNRAAGPLRIIFVGSLIPRKQLHTLIEAIAMLDPDSFLLDIVGDATADSEYADKVRKLIAEKKLADRVSFFGKLRADELADRYRHNDILCVPSSYEGFGIVYLEAMGHGLPAIASTAGAAHEIITEAETGFLVEPANSRALANTLKWCVKNRTQVAQMSAKALKRYKDHPTWTQSAAKFEKFIFGIVKDDN